MPQNSISNQNFDRFPENVIFNFTKDKSHIFKFTFLVQLRENVPQKGEKRQKPHTNPEFIVTCNYIEQIKIPDSCGTKNQHENEVF